MLDVFPVSARLENDALVLGGVPAAELADRFGTPLVVYCEETLREQARSLVAAVDRGGRVFYGTKAFANVELLRLLAREGVGADVSTLGEAYCRVLQAGTTAQESFSIISQLNDLTGISHATPTVYTDTLQDQLDEAFTEFADKFSEATGYTMPSIRSTCPICLHGVVKPVCLDCGHLVCHSCVMSPYLYRPDLQLKCPMCKRVGTWRKVYPA